MIKLLFIVITILSLSGNVFAVDKKRLKFGDQESDLIPAEIPTYEVAGKKYVAQHARREQIIAEQGALQVERDNKLKEEELKNKK